MSSLDALCDQDVAVSWKRMIPILQPAIARVADFNCADVSLRVLSPADSAARRDGNVCGTSMPLFKLASVVHPSVYQGEWFGEHYATVLHELGHIAWNHLEWYQSSLAYAPCYERVERVPFALWLSHGTLPLEYKRMALLHRKTVQHVVGESQANLFALCVAEELAHTEGALGRIILAYAWDTILRHHDGTASVFLAQFLAKRTLDQAKRKIVSSGIVSIARALACRNRRFSEAVWDEAADRLSKRASEATGFSLKSYPLRVDADEVVLHQYFLSRFKRRDIELSDWSIRQMARHPLTRLVNGGSAEAYANALLRRRRNREWCAEHLLSLAMHLKEKPEHAAVFHALASVIAWRFADTQAFFRIQHFSL